MRFFRPLPVPGAHGLDPIVKIPTIFGLERALDQRLFGRPPLAATSVMMLLNSREAHWASVLPVIPGVQLSGIPDFGPVPWPLWPGAILFSWPRWHELVSDRANIQ